MEIDFMGLSSSRDRMEQGGFKNAFTEPENEEVEISLSLSTSSSLDSQREILHLPKEKKWEFKCEKLIPSCSSSSDSTLTSLAYYHRKNAPKTEQPHRVLVPTPVFYPSPTTGGFRYDLNDSSTTLRKISQLPASLNILYSGQANVLNDTSDARKYTGGYTPTIAMARKATLARFLEKRLHRMNHSRTSNLMGKSVCATKSEAYNMSIMRCSKKKNKTKQEQLK